MSNSDRKDKKWREEKMKRMISKVYVVMAYSDSNNIVSVWVNNAKAVQEVKRLESEGHYKTGYGIEEWEIRYD